VLSPGWLFIKFQTPWAIMEVVMLQFYYCFIFFVFNKRVSKDNKFCLILAYCLTLLSKWFLCFSQLSSFFLVIPSFKSLLLAYYSFWHWMKNWVALLLVQCQGSQLWPTSKLEGFTALLFNLVSKHKCDAKSWKVIWLKSWIVCDMCFCL